MAKVTASEFDYIKAWQEYCESFKKSAIVDLTESYADKIKRKKHLEENHEEWFKYYFPNYCKSEPADFHKESTQRILDNDEWFEIKAWSRELAKSARSMMEFCYLAMIGRQKNVILASNTGENAERLLLPFKSFFESNPRLINDYGKQQKIGSWKSYEFTIRKGCTFRALGWRESPRGTRMDEVRPTGLLIDDFDDDEDCRNEETMTNKINWLEQALFGTRSISEPLLVVMNGNIIHDNCAILRMKDKADYFGIINIRDKNGKSTWPQKNSEKMIDRVLSIISYESAQKEYFNNPMDGSDTFKNLKDGKVPNLKTCKVAIYADPATSNSDKSTGSDKAVGIIAKKGFDYYIVRAFVDTLTTAQFIDALFECYQYCLSIGLETVPVYIENNSLQNPFYEQVFLPVIYTKSVETGVFLPVTPDTRDKPEKWSRIEGTLEPVNRLGHLYFNEDEKKNPHMKRLKSQFKSAKRKSKKLDGPDMVEGGVFKLKDGEAVEAAGNYESFKPRNSKKWDS